MLSIMAAQNRDNLSHSHSVLANFTVVLGETTSLWYISINTTHLKKKKENKLEAITGVMNN